MPDDDDALSVPDAYAAFLAAHGDADDPIGFDALPEDEVRDAARFYYDQAIAAQRRMEGLEAEVRRLRAFVRKVYDAARLPDYNVLENTTALEWETADLLGLTPDER